MQKHVTAIEINVAEQFAEAESVEREIKLRLIDTLSLLRLSDKLGELSVAQARSKASLQSFKRELEDSRMVAKGLFITFNVGLFVSIAGFFLWYFKSQRYQDEILLAQVKTIRG